MIKIIKVPGINGLSKTKGCEKTPDEIMKLFKRDNLNIQEIILELNNIDKNTKNIFLKSKEVFQDSFKSNDLNIFLGGDHSISFSIGRAFLENCLNKGKEPCLIVFDAHPDLMPVAFRKNKEKTPNHEEWLRGLIEEGFPSENILLVGIRNLDSQEKEFIKENQIKRISCDSIEEDIDNIADTIMEFTKGRNTYLSIDIDVIDPAFGCGTGYPEVGGLTSRQLLYLLKRINNIKNLKVVDIVEINSDLDDDNNLTVKLGSKILLDFLSGFIN